MFETLVIPSRDVRLFDRVVAIKPLGSGWCVYDPVDKWEVREITEYGIFDTTGYSRINFHATPCHVRVERSPALEMTTPDTLAPGDAILGYQYDYSAKWYSTYNPWIVHQCRHDAWYDSRGEFMFSYGRPGNIHRVLVRRATQRYANRALAESLATYLEGFRA